VGTQSTHLILQGLLLQQFQKQQAEQSSLVVGIFITHFYLMERLHQLVL
jgi:hypothetical protein